MPTYGKPDRLYTADDLLDGYDRNDPAAFTKSWDFRYQPIEYLGTSA